MMNNAPAVSVAGLTVVRGGRTVIDDISFRIPAGSLTGLLGPSGCGKSTLMRSIVGVQVLAGGTVEVLGQPAGNAPLRSKVAYVTQAPSVYADLTVTENLRYFAAVLGAPASDITRVLHEVGLGDRGDAVTGQLSGGQKARVSLATALLGEPQVLVLDEPTVGLDPVLRRDLWALFNGLAANGRTLLVSSHVMDEAQRCQRLLLLRDGRLLADETPEDLLTRTGQTDVEASFLSLIEKEQVPA